MSWWPQVFSWEEHLAFFEEPLACDSSWSYEASSLQPDVMAFEPFACIERALWRIWMTLPDGLLVMAVCPNCLSEMASIADSAVWQWWCETL